MSPVFELERTVSPRDIDDLGRASNLSYIAWMQEAAIAHSSAQGWSPERYRTEGLAWVVRSHHVEYLKPVAAGEKIRIRTWVADIKAATSLRRYEIRRAEDGTLLAEAATDWALIDASSGAPKRVPPSFRASFEGVARQE